MKLEEIFLQRLLTQHSRYFCFDRVLTCLIFIPKSSLIPKIPGYSILCPPSMGLKSFVFIKRLILSPFNQHSDLMICP